MYFLYKKIIFIFLFLSIFFCSPQSKSKDVLIIGTASDPSTNDPIFATDMYFQKLALLTFRSLYKIDSNGNIQPDLVKNVHHINSNSVLFTIHESKNNEDQYLKVDDIIYCIQRLKTENGPRRSLYDAIIQIEKISDNQIKIQYNASFPKLIELLSLSNSVIYFKNQFQQKLEFQSTGQYFIKKWSRNDKIQLERNLHFISNAPKELHFQVLPETSTAIYLFNKNQLDILKAPYFVLDQSVKKRYAVKSIKGKSVQYIAINHTNICFDSNFKIALNYAINRKQIIEKLFNNLAEDVATSMPISLLQVRNLSHQAYQYNYSPNIAKEYLKKSKCYPEITQRTLDLRMKADDENRSKGLVLQQNLKEIGLKIKLEPLEKTKLYKENSQKKGDLTLLTWFIDSNSIMNFIDPVFASDSFGNGGNRSFYKNTNLDKVINQIRSNQEPISNSELESILEMLYNDPPWIFLWSLYDNYIFSEDAIRYESQINLM